MGKKDIEINRCSLSLFDLHPQQRDRAQYLLDTGYQVYPMASNPPFEPRQRDDEEVYENMEGKSWISA